MIDKSVPHGSVIMVKRDMKVYPRYTMPEGFFIRSYRDGDEKAWADIALEQFDLESFDAAMKLYHEVFDEHPEWMDCALYAVEEKTGEIAAILTLWEGGIFDAPYKKIHWVATREKYQGRGIISAMMTYAMDLYHERKAEGYCLLQTGTWNWQAIRIYKKFGFEAWLGADPEPDFFYDPELENRNWRIINEKIAEFEASRG
ncbi:MAG: GNAT family N-acetyltransferase [Clostridia bacterium]|nr:GNAT family N-acetyltransferase [Clostridia bacterium]